jgi:hypothetical protein
LTRPASEDLANLVRICRALNDAGARYVLIGGFAVIAHGASRFTKAIDLLVDDSPENVARVKPHLMGRACGLAYADVAADMEWHDLSGVRVPVASPAALVRTKDTDHPQDTIDRAFLQQLLASRRRRVEAPT